MNGRQGLTSSGLKSADAAITVMTSQLFSVQLFGDGTNPASLTIYDNPSAASGLVIAKITLDAGLVEANPQIFNHGVVANNGIYCDVSGTGAEYIVHYVLGA